MLITQGQVAAAVGNASFCGDLLLAHHRHFVSAQAGEERTVLLSLRMWHISNSQRTDAEAAIISPHSHCYIPLLRTEAAAQLDWLLFV